MGDLRVSEHEPATSSLIKPVVSEKSYAAFGADVYTFVFVAR